MQIMALLRLLKNITKGDKMKELKDIKSIKKEIKLFLKDSNKKKLEIKVPKGFKINSICNPFGLLFRKIMIAILSKVPPMELKRWIFVMMGYDFRKDVCLPGFIDISPYFPKLMCLDEGVLVGGYTKINTYTLKDNILTLGRIHVKRRVLLGGMTTVNPGVTIEEGTLTGMNAIVTKDVPKDSFVIKQDVILATWTDEQREKYFGESKHDPNFAKKVRKLTRKFRKDKKIRKIEFRNDGKRLNAGCEWWRARPVLRIYYNGIFVELAQLCPFEFGRKLLYWFMGQNLFGRNINLGKKVVFDHIYGDMVQVGRNVVIEDGVFLDGHEYTTSETTYGRTIIEGNVVLKKGSYVREALTVGEGAVVEENSFAMKDIGPGEIWKGAPAKLVGNVGEEEE